MLTEPPSNVSITDVKIIQGNALLKRDDVNAGTEE